MKNGLVDRINTSLASVKELSILSDIPTATIHNWRHGKSRPKGRDITRIEEVLNAITTFTTEQIKQVVEYKTTGDNENFERIMKKPFTNEAHPVPFTDFMEAPYLPITAQAGYAKGFGDNSQPETLETKLVPKEFEKGNYLVIEISGDSMDDGTSDSICAGDFLLVKELPRESWQYKLHFKDNIFVIVTNDGVVCKQIIAHDVEENIITCHSYNAAVKDFTLSLANDVRQLFYVKKIVEKKIKHKGSEKDKKTSDNVKSQKAEIKSTNYATNTPSLNDNNTVSLPSPSDKTEMEEEDMITRLFKMQEEATAAIKDMSSAIRDIGAGFKDVAKSNRILAELVERKALQNEGQEQPTTK